VNKTLEELPTDIHNHIISITKMAQKPLNWLHGILGFIVLLISITTLIGGGYILNKNIQTTQRNSDQLELLNKNYVLQNQQTILLKIIDQNLRDSKDLKLGSAPIEEKVKLSQTFYELSILKKIPLSLLCAIAETESGWNTHAISEAGCVGILQVTPRYARVYLREKGLNYKPDIWFDPIVNSICGISILCDFQDDCLEKGLATPDNFTYATRCYFWGPATRGNVFDMNYSMKVIESQKKYKEMGL